MFELNTEFTPQGDQPKAIEKLLGLIKKNKQHSTLLGATGTGKTFTIANVIQNLQRPALVISPNKTLAAQLYQEFHQFLDELIL